MYNLIKLKTIITDLYVIFPDLSSISKLLSGNHCTRKRIGLGHSLITTLLAVNGGEGSSEGSGNIEPDQSQLESIAESQQHAYHMRISLSDDNVLGKEGASTLGDFYGNKHSVYRFGQA